VDKFTEEMRVMILSFPVLWWGGIDFMFPLFFRNPVVDSEFNVTMMTALKAMRPSKFCDFVDRHGLIDLIIKSNCVNPGNERSVAQGRDLVTMNPFVLELAVYIASEFGQDMGRLAMIMDSQRRFEKEFSRFIVEQALPYRDLLRVEAQATGERSWDD
jgi:hypothetical protein